MIKVYKLTDVDGYTRRGMSNETLWSEGSVVEATGTGGLCTPGLVHAYRYPELGLAMNPIHANLREPRVWLCEGVIREDDGTKLGCRRLRCLYEMKVDHQLLSIDGLIRWSIYMAKLVVDGGTAPEWDEWADGWLSGQDRSERAARAAQVAAGAVVEAARAAAVEAARAAAWAGARAARDTGYSTYQFATLAQDLLLQSMGEEA